VQNVTKRVKISEINLRSRVRYSHAALLLLIVLLPLLLLLNSFVSAILRLAFYMIAEFLVKHKILQ